MSMLQRARSPRSVALLALIAACSAVFLTALDQTVVVTALPAIIQDMSIPVQQLDRAAWIISAYLLGYVIAMPLMGRVSDMYGRRLVFVICLSIFGVASLFCGLATQLGNSVDITFLQHFGINVAAPGDISDPAQWPASLTWLIAARFVQAAGGGAIIPVAMAVAGDYYGSKQRSLALGLVGMVTEAGGVLGPLYGSLIVQTWNWHVIFYLNIPLVAILIGLILWLVRPGTGITGFEPRPSELATSSPTPAHNFARARRERVDLAGTLLLGASLICLSLGLSQEAATTPVATPGAATAPIQNNPVLIGAAIVLLIAFIALEALIEQRILRTAEQTEQKEEQTGKQRRYTLPIVELSVFQRPAFAATSLVSLLVGAALIIAMADIPLFIATVLGGQPLDSGLALLRLTVMIPIGAIVGGWLCARITCRVTAILGLLPAALGFWLMHLWPVHVNWTQITISTLICGFGFGLVIAPISTTAINAVRNRQMGMAASVVTVLRMVGMILGLAALTSWGLGRFRELAAAFKPPPGVTPLSPTYNAAYQAYVTLSAQQVFTSLFFAAGVICLVAIVPAFLLEGRKPSPYNIRP